MDRRSPSLLSGAALLTGVGLFSQALGFCYRVALSRRIGAEAMGLYQLVMPLCSLFLSLTASGLTVAVSTLSARRRSAGEAWGVLRRCLGAFFLLALPLGLLTALGSDPLSVHLLGDARTRLGILLLTPWALLAGVENLHKHCFYGLGILRLPAAVEAAEQVIRAAAVLGLLALPLPRSGEETVGLILLGMVLCEVFSALTLTLLFRRLRRREGPILSPPPSWGQIGGAALPVALTSLAGTAMGAAGSVLVPQRLAAGGMDPAQAVAAFGVMTGMALPLLALPTGLLSAMGLVLTPHLARAEARRDRREMGAAAERALGAAALLVTPALALLAAAGPTLGELLFRQAGAGELILPLAAGVWLSCGQALLSGVLNGIGRQGEAARCALLSDGLQLAFTWGAVPPFGLAGYAAGLVLSSLAGLLLAFRGVARATGLRWRVWLRALPPLLASLLAGLCAALLLRLLLAAGLPPAAALAATALFGLVLYAAALAAQGALLLPPRP